MYGKLCSVRHLDIAGSWTVLTTAHGQLGVLQNDMVLGRCWATGQGWLDNAAQQQQLPPARLTPGKPPSQAPQCMFYKICPIDCLQGSFDSEAEQPLCF